MMTDIMPSQEMLFSRGGGDSHNFVMLNNVLKTYIAPFREFRLSTTPAF